MEIVEESKTNPDRVLVEDESKTEGGAEQTHVDGFAEGEKGIRVRFDTIEIREYPRCLGDHPAVTVGPPLSLGWKYKQRYLLDLEEYEKYRGDVSATDESDESTEVEDAGSVEQPQGGGGRRRCPAEFQLPSSLRHQILHEECSVNDPQAQQDDTACTKEEIRNRMKECQKTKMQRRSSYAMHDFEDMQIFLESCGRKLKRLRKSLNKGKRRGASVANNNSAPERPIKNDVGLKPSPKKAGIETPPNWDQITSRTLDSWASTS